MSNTIKTAKTTEEKVALRDAKILKLQNEKKQILQREKAKERKERTSRLCRRHGLLEKFMPKLITLTDAQFEAFVRTGINTKYGRDRLDEIIGKGAEAASAYISKCHSEESASGVYDPPEGSAVGA
jgi:hypothetical protein